MQYWIFLSINYIILFSDQIIETNKNVKEIMNFLLSNFIQKDTIESSSEIESTYSNFNESDISISEYFQKRSIKDTTSQRHAPFIESGETIVTKSNNSKHLESVLPDNIFCNLSFNSKETPVHTETPRQDDGDWLSRYDILG